MSNTISDTIKLNILYLVELRMSLKRPGLST
jgi:hypothetical protein